MSFQLPIGANVTPDGTHFRVWAASVAGVELVLYSNTENRESRTEASEVLGSRFSVLPMQPTGDGYYEIELPGIGAGTRYMYRLAGIGDRPDPASRFQPLGVHGPSEVVDPTQFNWNDSVWRGIPIEDATVYELHIGTFTPGGTFDSAIEKLDELVNLGVTAIEVMPVADFPGERNWGYDGVCLFAPAHAYGGPEALRRLVDAAHKRGLAVILDVVYNHLGPDGNYLRQFSEHYFTSHHKTPWGDALNFDDLESKHVRQFFVANACYWANEYHLDGFRLDATHEIKDDSEPHILAEIVASVHATLAPDRQLLFIAEDERNEPMLVQPQNQESRTENQEQHGSQFSVLGSPNRGYGLDALWADDFHHQVRVALTGDQEGYFADFSGTTADLVQTIEQGWFYSGQFSDNLSRARGAPTTGLPTTAFVYCIQNHDQVGNRALGDRLSDIVGLDAYRAAAALLLCSPYVPMLWQGQEWAAATPFLFFTDHNAELGKLVTEGRRKEFAYFTAFAHAEVPDPQAENTFTRSKLDWSERQHPPHAGILALHRDLLQLRRESPALRTRGRDSFAVLALGDDGLAIRREGGEALLLVVNLRGEHRYELNHGIIGHSPDQRWTIVLSSEDERYGGSGGAGLEGGTAVFAGPGTLLLRAQ